MTEVIKICAVHGPLGDSDVRRYKSNISKSGYEIRCYKCRNEKAWKEGIKCKTHGLLGKEDVKSNGRCKECHRHSVKKSRDKDRDSFNSLLREKVNRDKIENPEKWKARQKRY